MHAYAGRIEEANEAQDAALAAYPSGNYQGRGQIALHRAAAHIQANDIGNGAKHLAATMESLEPWQRVDGILQRTAMVILNMIPPRHRDQSSVRLAREVVMTSQGNG